MLLKLIRKLGRASVAGLLSVETRQLGHWLAPDGYWKPRDRKLVWLIYALHFEPEKLSSSFDIITCGRFHVGK